MKYDIVTIGGSTEDIMYYTDQAVLIKNKHDILRQQLLGFEFGAKIVAKKVLFTFGGGGSNTAVNFSRLGFKTGVITAVGDDGIGQMITKNFQDNKVSTALIQHSRLAPSGLSFVINYSGSTDHVILKLWSANDLLEIKAVALGKITTPWFYLTALPQRRWQANLTAVFKTAAKNKIKVAWNPGASQLARGFPALKQFLKQTAVLILNKDEAIELALSFGQKTTRLASLLKYIKQMGPAIVAITEGARGATVCSNEQVCFERALRIKGVNTTGAGDAFGSSLVGGLLLYKDLKRALHLAIIQSNHVIRQIGAQKGLLRLGQIKKY